MDDNVPISADSDIDPLECYVPLEEDDNDKYEDLAVHETKRKCGKPIHPCWEDFTESLNAHQVSSGKHCICKHCNHKVTHHNKAVLVQRHLGICKPFLLKIKSLSEDKQPL